MTMPADAAEIVRLAERVEQALGPDRELDADIQQLVDGPLWKRAKFPSRYTASLDAAMTLVPEGQASECLNDAVETLGVAGWNGRWRDALPRFLAAAALRTRAAQHDREVG